MNNENEWIDVKNALPEHNAHVLVRINIFSANDTVCRFKKGRFLSRGVDITKWISHWKHSFEKEE